MAEACHRIQRDDGQEDARTQMEFSSYDSAYDELERYYRDFCCSDDERIDYTIVCVDPSKESSQPDRGVEQYP